MQVSSSGQIYNGTGTQVTNLVLTSVTASFNGLINSASTAIVANTATSASYALTASYALSAAIDISNLATTGSNTFIGNQSVTGNVNVTGTLTANTYVLSSSVTNMTIEFASGSTAFGNSSDDTHTFIGSVTVTGSFLVSGSSTFRNIGPAEFTGSVISTQGFTGSLSGTAATASYAIAAETALNVKGTNVDGAVSDSSRLGGLLAVNYALNTSLTGFATTSSLASASVATASYINPTFISASAAASGFGTGGGTSVTINNNTDNYVVTATGTANTLNGESALTFDGTTLSIVNSSTSATPSQLLLKTTGDGGAGMQFENSDFSTNRWQLFVTSDNTGFKIGRDNVADYFTITGSTGYIGIGTNAPSEKLEVNGNVKATTFIGSLTGTATTASYIDPAVIVTAVTEAGFANTGSIGSTITSTTETPALAPNTFYTVNSTSGSINITLEANVVGAEFTFFATNLTNNIAFVAGGGVTIVSEDGYLKMNKVGSAVTAKYYTSSTVALIGSLKA
jgi:hypothetical protein